MRETGPYVDSRIVRASLLGSVQQLLGFALNKGTQLPHARRSECALHQAAHARVILAVEKVNPMRKFVARGAARKELMEAFRNGSGPEPAISQHRVCRGITDHTGDA